MVSPRNRARCVNTSALYDRLSLDSITFFTVAERRFRAREFQLISAKSPSIVIAKG
jgi:hypothetical protein